MTTLLRAEHLSRRFGEVVAVDDVTIEVEAGEVVAIAGRSGSGKTTLLSLLAGLDRPDAGRIAIAGEEMTTADAAAWARVRLASLGFVFQNFLLQPGRTARQNVMLPLLLAGRTPAEAAREAGAALEVVELAADADRPAGKLSGGQRQRVAFARAIAGRPALVLADEPTGNLDEETAAALLSAVARLRTERRMAFLIVTHDPLVGDYADRACRMQAGRLEELVASSPPRQ